jgi:hypothetical protein
VVGFVSAIINFYVWLFTTLMGTAQKAFGAVTGETVETLYMCKAL